MYQVTEADWKVFKKVKNELIQRFCREVNRKAETILKNEKKQNDYEIYIELYRHCAESDKVIAMCFDDHRRSTALIMIYKMCEEEIATVDDLADFSDEFREKIKSMMQWE